MKQNCTNKAIAAFVLFACSGIPAASGEEPLPGEQLSATKSTSLLTRRSRSESWRPHPLDLAPAKWIWLPSQRTLPNSFVLFRKDIDLPATPSAAFGWIAADSRYTLTVRTKGMTTSRNLMGIASLSAVLVASCAPLQGQTEKTTMQRTIDGETYVLEQMFDDPFDDFSNWITFSTTSKWWVENGSLFGRWAEKGGGSNVWCRKDFEGDVLAEFHVRLIEPDEEWRTPGRPDGGKNINLRIHVTGPDGGDILAVAKKLQDEGTGPNRIGDDQYRGYFFTWTYRHGRLRRSPGYENVSENREDLPKLGPWYTVTVLYTGGRLRQFIDGKKIHDDADAEPFTCGKMGFALWHSAIEVDRFRVFRIADNH